MEYLELWVNGKTFPVKEKIKGIAKQAGGVAWWEDNVWKVVVPFQHARAIQGGLLSLPEVNLAKAPGPVQDIERVKRFLPRSSAPPAPSAPSAQAGMRLPPQQQPQKPRLPLLKVLGLKETEWGKKIVVIHALDAMKNTQLREKFQKTGLWRGAIGFLGKAEDGSSQYGITPSAVKQVRDVMAEYLDVSQLDELAGGKRGLIDLPGVKPEPSRPQPQPQAKPTVPKTRTFLFEDKGTVEIEDPNLPADERGQHRRILQRLKIMYQPGELLSDAEKTLRIQLVSYNFEQVQREKEILGNSDTHGRERYRVVYYVAGTYDQYVIFGKLLKRYGFDTKQYRAIFDHKFKDRTGQYPAKVESDPSEDFIDNIPKELPKNQLQLYDAQKRGIGFLYGRRRAILGDETGTGKTAQLIGAAELKMKESGYDGDTLIITVNDDVIGQWEEEILKVIGENSANLISTDPLNPKRWTILHYHMFSPASPKAKENTSKAMHSLMNHNFKIVIFDELHKVKHKDAAKSKHLFEVIRSIPTKWGASATISSNKPMDVKNQLRMLGHTLGYIDDRKFKADFAAVGKKGKRKSPLEKFKDQVRAAENLNKWLHLTGVYVRRKKSDIRQDMPNIKIGETADNIDVGEFQAGLERRIQKLKKVMPLTVLGQARLQLAISKVPLTVKRVAQLVAEGKRVVVFTSFIVSGMLLVEGYGGIEGLRAAVKRIGAEQGHPEWDVLTYTSGTPLKERMSVKPRFNKEPSAGNPYRVLIMSIKMGGTGVDFPNAATHMVINDYDWTPESCEQSEGRIYRINTNQPVNIEYILADGTIDTLLYEKVQRKRELAAIIQQWRKDYQDELEPARANAALEQIVKAQAEIRQIDQEVESEAMRLKKRGGGKTYGEGLTFKSYLDYFREDETPSVFDAVED